MYQEINYFIDGKEAKLCCINGNLVSEAEIEALRKKYYEKGFKERMAGFYDKWYRYNTFDNGASYDRGCVAAVDSGKCKPDCQIIEYNTYL